MTERIDLATERLAERARYKPGNETSVIGAGLGLTGMKGIKGIKETPESFFVIPGKVICHVIASQKRRRKAMTRNPVAQVIASRYPCEAIPVYIKAKRTV